MSYRGLFQNFVAEYHVVSLLYSHQLTLDGIRPNLAQIIAVARAAGKLSGPSPILVSNPRCSVEAFQRNGQGRG
jgi:hypothetical protein